MGGPRWRARAQGKEQAEKRAEEAAGPGGRRGGGGEGRSRVVSRKPERARVGRGGGRKREQGVGRIN